MSGKPTSQELTNRFRTTKQKRTMTKTRPKIVLWLQYTKCCLA